MDNVMGLLENLSLLHWIIAGIVYVLSVGFGVFLATRWFWRTQRRLYRNLKRPVLIITPTDSQGGKIHGTEMEVEKKFLSDNGFLNIDDGPTDYRSFNPNHNHCVVVLGYHPNMQGLDEVLMKVKNSQVPLIVYTFGKNINVISETDKNKLDTYPLTLYANFQLTLANHIFTTLATYPYDQK